VKKHQERNILDFKTFESKEEHLSVEDINEIFIEVFDLGYVAKFHNKEICSRNGIYYFDLKKESQRSFGWMTAGHSWGCTDMKAMSKEMSDLFSLLDDIKERLNSMGYTIGFEPEFSFAESSMFSIVCHMQHSSQDEEEDDYEVGDNDYYFN
jgi:hypothetical protein